MPTPRFNPRGGDRRGQRQLPGGRSPSLWYALAFIVVLGVAQIYFLAPTGQSIPYSEFKSRVKSGEITEVVAYRTVGADADREGEPDVYRMLLERRIDVVTFTSASSMKLTV